MGRNSSQLRKIKTVTKVLSDFIMFNQAPIDKALTWSMAVMGSVFLTMLFLLEAIREGSTT